MEYRSKTYCLSEEVIGLLEGLRAQHGSVNKGLLAVLLPSAEATSTIPAYQHHLAIREACEPAEATGTIPYKLKESWTGPLLKPGERGKK